MFYQTSGYQNENDFCQYLNKKKIGQLDPIFEELFIHLFGKKSLDLCIKAKVDYGRKKYDLLVEIAGVTKRISIKKGVNNSMHSEPISSFVEFLKDSNVDKKIIKNYLRYHYADGTIDGSGTNRISASEYKEQFNDEIEKINNAINHPEVLTKAIDRFVLCGRNSDKKIDAIIHGTVDSFLWVTKKEIEEIVSNTKIQTSGVHFGPLYCQSLQRCLNNNETAEHRRHFIQIKWYSLVDDIIKYMNETRLYNAEEHQK